MAMPFPPIGWVSISTRYVRGRFAEVSGQLTGVPLLVSGVHGRTGRRRLALTRVPVGVGEMQARLDEVSARLVQVSAGAADLAAWMAGLAVGLFVLL